MIPETQQTKRPRAQCENSVAPRSIAYASNGCGRTVGLSRVGCVAEFVRSGEQPRCSGACSTVHRTSDELCVLRERPWLISIRLPVCPVARLRAGSSSATRLLAVRTLDLLRPRLTQAGYAHRLAP